MRSLEDIQEITARNSGKFTTQMLLEKLSKKYPSGSYAFLSQVRNGTGFPSTIRTADAMAMGLWPSRGLHLTGFELKVSRSDWLTEYKKPAKAEEMVQFCDFWYVVAADESIVLDGELPANWGLMTASGRGRSIKIIKPAPKLEPIAMDRLFFASLCRNITEGMIHKDLLKTKFREQFEAGEKHSQYGYESLKWYHQHLLDRINKFQQISGLTIDGYRGDDMAQAVKDLMDGKHKEVEQELEKLRTKVSNLLKYIDGEIEYRHQI